MSGCITTKENEAVSKGISFHRSNVYSSWDNAPFLFSFLPILINPNSTITVNGVPTSELGTKLSAVLLNASFVGIGLFALFGPSSFFNKRFVWRQSLTSTLLPKKR